MFYLIHLISRFRLTGLVAASVYAVLSVIYVPVHAQVAVGVKEALAAPIDGDRLTQLLRDPDVSAFLADLSAEGLVESDCPLPASQTPAPLENDREPPRIEWREEVRRFAGGCAFIPAGSEQCFQDPSTS